MTYCKYLIVNSSFVLVLGLLSISNCHAMAVEKRFDDVTIHFSVFNSSFIKPDIAKIYGLVRSKERALVNIAVTQNNPDPTIAKPTIKAIVTGYFTNLMSQKTQLKFQEIHEQSATYYLAGFRFTNEEIVHFTIQVQPDPNKPARKVKFSRKMYIDQ